MPKHLRILKTALAVSLLISSIHPLEGIIYVWQGTNVNQNLNVNTNWSPVGIPTSGDAGQFTSSTNGLTPTLTGGVGFDIDLFQFTNVAGADSYSFLITNNSGLRF